MNKHVKKGLPYLALALLIVMGICGSIVYQKAHFYVSDQQFDFGPVSYAPLVPFPEIKNGVWLHRNNSVERIRHFLDKYPGFEIDAYYIPERDDFNVDHDGDDHGTTLDDIFSVLSTKSGVYAWLDIKHLPDEQVEAMERRLAALLEKHNFPKDHVFVEFDTASPAPLRFLGERGYITVYDYWPGENWSSGRVEFAQRQFEASGASCMTVEIIYYDLAHAAFPDVPKLVWDMKSYSRRPLTYMGTLLRQRLIFNNPDVKVHLVGSRTLRR